MPHHFTLITLSLLFNAVSASVVHPYVQWANAPKVAARLATNQTTLGQKELAVGIGLNIMAQQGEVAATSEIMSLMEAGLTDPQLFKTAKDNLLIFIQAGMKIRMNNMGLAKNNTQIIRGLAQVEQAQVIELSLANNLTGNPTTDMPILKNLQGNFQAGIQKNKGLQSLASGSVAVPVPMQT